MNPTDKLPTNQILSISQAASYLGISTKTLRRWEAAGIISPIRNDHNQRQYSLEMLIPLAERKYQPIPKEINSAKLNAPAVTTHLSISDAAKELQVSQKSLRRWDDQGLIKSDRNDLNHRIFSVEEINRVKRARLNGTFNPVIVSPIIPQITANVATTNLEPVKISKEFKFDRNKFRPATYGVLAAALFMTGLFATNQLLPTSNNSNYAFAAQTEPKESLFSQILGITTSLGNNLNFKNIIDNNYNFGVAGTIEGNQIISSTNNKAPLVVSSTQRVANLNADLLDGKHLSEIEALIGSSGSLQAAYSSGATINTDAVDIVFNLTDQTNDADFKVNILGNNSTYDINGNAGESIVLISPNATYPVNISKNTRINGTISLNGPVLATSTLTFDDANTSSSIPFSDGSNTTLPAGYSSVLDVLADISSGGSGLFTDGGTVTYRSDTNDDFAIGGSGLSAALSVDVSNNRVRIGTGSSTNGSLEFFASDGDSGLITYNTSDEFNFGGGNVIVAQDLRVEGADLFGANGEYINIGGTDDLIAFVGTGGSDNTDLYVNLDGSSPIIYSNTDTAIGIDDDLSFVGAQTISTTAGNLTLSPAGSFVVAGLNCTGNASGGALTANASGVISCSDDDSGNSIAAEENDVAVSATVTTFDFLGNDFTLSESPAGEINVSLDYANSSIARTNQAESISGAWSFTNGISLSGSDLNIGANNIVTSLATISAAELNLLDSGILLSELTDSGTLTAGTVDINGGAIDGTVIGAGSASSGTFTNLTSTGNTIIGNANTDSLTINAGTSGTGIRFTDATFASCTALETDASGDLVCGTDDAGMSGSTVQENDVTAVASTSTFDFLGNDFTVSETPAGEANISIDYANSFITRSNQNQTISGTWAFSNDLTVGSLTLNSQNFTNLSGTGLAFNAGNLDIDATEIATLLSTWDQNSSDDLTTGNYAATLDSIYVNVGESPAAGDITGTFSGGLNIGADVIDFTEIADSLTLDATTTITAAIGRSLNFSKAFTDATSETGLNFGFSGSDSTSSTTAQYGLYLDNLASTEGLDGLLVLDNSDSDDAVASAIRIIDAGGGFTNIFEIGGTGISTSEFTVLDSGIALGSETSGDYVASITSGNGLTGSASGEGSTPTFDIDLLDSADGTGSTSSFSGLEFVGASNDELALIQGCSDGNVLKWDNTNNVWTCGSDNTGGAASSLSWDDLLDPDANESLAMNEFTTTFTYNTADTAAAFDGFTFSIQNDATTDATAQELLTLSNADAAGSTNTEVLLRIENLDSNEAVTNGLIITSAAGGITTAVDLSDSDIVTALSLGANDIAATNFSITGSTGDITTSGILNLNGDQLTADGNLTIAATGYVQIGDSGTPDNANGDDDLYVTGDIEADGTFYGNGSGLTNLSTSALSGVLFNTAGDSGTSSYSQGDVVTILGGTNLTSVDNGSGSITLNLDNSITLSGNANIGSLTINAGTFTNLTGSGLAINSGILNIDSTEIATLLSGWDQNSSDDLTTGNYSGTLDSVYVNVGENPAVGDISGSFSGGFTIEANSVALGTDTTGNFVDNITGGDGLTVTGSAGEGWEPDIAIDLLDANSGLTFSTGELTIDLDSNSGLALNAGGLAINSSIAGTGLDYTAGVLSVTGLTSSEFSNDTLDFAQFADAMTLDANTDIAIGSLTLSTSGTGALNFASTGQVTFAGNVDANNGLDVTGNLTVTGQGSFGSVNVNGNIALTGTVDGRDVSADGANLDTLYTTIGLSALTSAEVDQLENIGSVAISNTEWGYLGDLNQALTTTSDVTFDDVSVGSLTINSGTFTNLTGSGLAINNGILNVDATEIAALLSAWDQNSSDDLTTGNYSGTLDSVYVNVGESPAAGDITGSFSGGLNIGADSVALGTDTTGNFVDNITGGDGLTVTGSTGEGWEPDIAIDLLDANSGLGFSSGELTIDLDTNSGLTLNAGGLAVSPSIAGEGLSWEDGVLTVAALTSSGVASDSLNFAQFVDAMTLDANTDIALGSLTLSTSGTGALNFASTGQVTFAGNVDANNGLDVTGNLTVSGQGSFGSVNVNGNIALTGTVDGRDVSADGANLDTLYTTIGLSALTSAEVDQLENIGTTAISATEWGYLGNLNQELTTTSDVSFDDVSVGSLTINSGTFTNLTGSGLAINNGILNVDSTEIATLLSAWDQNSSDDLTTGNYTGTLDSVYVNVGESPAAGDITGSFSGGLNIGADIIDFTEIADALTLDANTDIALGALTLSTSGTGAIDFASTGQVTFAGNVDADNGLDVTGNLTVSSDASVGSLTINSGTFTNLTGSGLAINNGILNVDSTEIASLLSAWDQNSSDDLTTSNYTGTLDSVYVNVGESPAAGDITGSFSGGLNIGADVIDFTEIADALTLDADTTISAFGSADTLTIANGLNLSVQGSLTVGSDSFSDLTGNGLELNGNTLQLASSTAGSGLTYSTGVLNIGASDGITVNADNIAINLLDANSGLAFSTGELTIDLDSNSGLSLNAGGLAINSSIAGTGLDYTAGVLSVTGLTSSEISNDTLDFAQFADAMTLDANTDIALGSLTLSTSGTGALNFASTGQVTFAGNVDANSGLDVTGNLTVSGQGSFGSVNVNGNIALTGTVDGRDVSADGANLDTLYTTIGLSALTSAEVDQLENIGATAISATEWGYLGNLNQELTTTSDVTFDDVSVGSLTINSGTFTNLTGSGLAINNGILNIDSTEIATLLSTWDQNSSDDLTTGNYTGTLDSVYVNVGESPAAGDITGSFSGGLNIGADIIDFTEIADALTLDADTTFSAFGSADTLTIANGLNLSIQGSLTVGSDSFSDLTGNGLELSSATLAINLLGSADGTGSTSNNSGLEFGGSNELALLQGCSDGNILKWNEATSVWACGSDNTGGAASSLAWDDLLDPDADLALSMNEYSTTFTQNTADTAAALDGFTFSIVNDASTDANAQNLLTLSNADAAGSSATETLLTIENLDTNEAVTSGLIITSAAGGITTAVDLSDAEIVTALALGSNDVTVGGATISSSEFALLDGRDTTLLDLNDAVNTAITGTGALNSGSITSGFGSIDLGSDNFTTTGTASVGALTINSGTFTNLTGSGLAINNGILNVDSTEIATLLSAWDQNSSDDLTTGNYSGTLDSVYVNVGESPAAGDITGSFSGGLNIGADVIDFDNIADSAILDADTTFSAFGSADTLTIANGLNLSVQGSLTVGSDSFSDLTGNGLELSSTTLAINLLNANSGLAFSSGELTVDLDTNSGLALNAGGLAINSSIAGTGLDYSAGVLSVTGLTSSEVANDTLDFAQFEDQLNLDANTDIALGALTLSTSGTGALNFASTGQVTFAGNVDANSGLDVTGNITVSGTVDGRDIASDGSNLDNLYTTIGLSALTSAEVDQLENIGTTAISATEWGYLGALDQGLATTDSVTFDDVSVGSLTINSGTFTNLTGSGLAINNGILNVDSTEMASLLSGWDQNSSDDLTTGNYTGTLDSVYVNVGESPAAGDITGSFSGGLNIGADVIDFAEIADALTLDADTTISAFGSADTLTIANGLNLSVQGSLTVGSDSFSDLTGNGLELSSTTLAINLLNANSGLTFSSGELTIDLDTNSGLALNAGGLAINSSIAGTGLDYSAGVLSVTGLTSSEVANDTLDFAQFEDQMNLDANTDIALGALTLSTSGTGALNFASTGQVTFAGNVDATNGLDVTGNITVSGTVDGRDIANDGSNLDNLYTTIGLSALTSAEVDQLENIGTTAISATEWGYLGNLNQELTTTSDVTFDNISVGSLTINSGTFTNLTGSGLAINNGILNVDSTEIASLLSAWDQNSSDDLTTGNYTGTLDSVYVNVGESPAAGDITGSFSGGLNIGSDVIDFDNIADSAILDADTTFSAFGSADTLTIANGLNLSVQGSLTVGSDSFSDLTGNGLELSSATLAINLLGSADGTGSNSNNSGLEFAGTGELALLQGCGDNQILKWSEAGNTWSCSNDVSGAGSIGLDDAYNVGGTITVDAYDVLFNLNDATNDYALVIDNTTTGAIATGLEFTTSGLGSSLTTAIDLSDADIATALALGSNDVTVGGATLTSTEFARLDGKDAALVDTNDAVATAITGTGALDAGSITSNFGAIDLGSDNFTTTGTASVGSLTINSGTFTNLTGSGLAINNGILNVDSTEIASLLSAWDQNSSDDLTTGNYTGTLDSVYVNVGESPAAGDITGSFSGGLNIGADVIDFTELADALTLDADTTISGSGASDTLTLANTINLSVQGSLTVGSDSFSDLTGNGLELSSTTLAINLLNANSGLTFSSGELTVDLDTNSGLALNAGGLAINSSIAGTGLDYSAGVLSVSGLTSAEISNDTLDFAQFEDQLNLDANTDIALGALTLSTSGTGALNFASTGQVTFAGNVDANSGLDVTGNITVSGTVDGRDVAADGSNLDNLYTTIGLSALTSAEVDQLENIGTTAISATEWGYLGNLNQELTTTSDVTFDNVSVGSLTINSGTFTNLTGSGLAINNGILNVDATEIASLLSGWDQNSSDDLTTGNYTGTLDSVYVNVGESPAAGDITGSFSGGLNIGADVIDFTEIADALTLDADTTISGSGASDTLTLANTINLSVQGSLTVGSDSFSDLTGNGLELSSATLAINLLGSADGTGSTSNNSGLEFGGSNELALIQGCSDNQILKWDDDTSVWACAADNTGSASLQASYDGGQTINVNAADLLFQLSDATNDYALVIDNSSTGAVATGLEFTTSGVGSSLTTAIDLSDADIATALALGSNDVTVGGATISSTEFARLDGKDAALVDTNDAVATAITGTGALDAGSITSNFGAIDLGSDNFTTTGTASVGSLTLNSQTFTNLTGTGLGISNGNLQVDSSEIANILSAWDQNSSDDLTTGNYTGTLDSVYVNVGESPAAGDISGSFSGGLSIAADVIDFTDISDNATLDATTDFDLSSYDLTFSNGASVLAEFDTAGKIGFGGAASGSDYLMNITSDTTDDYSRAINIAFTNDTMEDQQAVGITNLTNIGDYDGQFITLNNIFSEITPTVNHTGASNQLFLYGIESELDNSNIVYSGDSNSLRTYNEALRGRVNGNFTFDGRGFHSNIGVKGQITMTPTITSIAASSSLDSYAGYFTTNVQTAGDANLTSNTYGIFSQASGNLTTTGTTTHYGAYIWTSGTADNNYGVYIRDVSDATNNYGLYAEGATDLNYFAGNLGIGDDSPAALLTVGTSDAFQVDASGNITTSGTLAVNGDTITADGATLVINSAGTVDIQDALTANSLTLDSGSLTLQNGETIANSSDGTIAFTDGTNTLLSIIDQGTYGFLRYSSKTDTGNPGTCSEGDTYYNSFDNTFNVCTAANTWTDALAGGSIDADSIDFTEISDNATLDATTDFDLSSYDLTISNGANILAEFDTAGKIGFGGAASGSDYLVNIISDTTDDYSRTVNIALTNDTLESSQALAISNTANVGSLGATNTTIEGIYSNTQPTATVNAGGILSTYGQNSNLNLSNITLGGDDISSNLNQAIYANVTGGSTWTSGGNQNNYGINSSVSLTPTLTSVDFSSVINSISGRFYADLTSAGHADLISRVYGIQAVANGNLTTTGTTEHYAGHFSAAGTADTNYGVYITDITNGTNNYGLYVAGSDDLNLIAGNLDVNNGLDVTGNVTATGTLAVNGDSITADGATLTINAAGAVDIQDSLTADSLTLDSGSLTLQNGEVISNSSDGTVAITDGTNTLLSIIDQGTYGFVRYSSKTDTGNPGTCSEGDTYYNSFDNTFNVCTAANTWTDALAGGSAASWSALTAPTGNLSLALSTHTSTFTSTATTTNPWTFNFDSLTTGTGFDYSLDALTTGKGLYLNSTSTALTTGNLLALDWSATGSIVSTADLFSINVGSGEIVDSLLTLSDNGSDLFKVAQNKITSAVPHEFTAAGDVAIAYDLQFTNQTASTIKSNGPLSIESGESFESQNLTLKTYNSGDTIIANETLGTIATFNANGSVAIGDPAAMASANIPAGSFIISSGALCIDDGGTNCDDGARTAGQIYAENATVTAIDLAETYPSNDSLEAGDVVVWDSANSTFVTRNTASNSQMIAGIVSTKPGILLGGFGSQEHPTEILFPVALRGRVPVKVSNENGAIQIGDALTTSSTPGVAMKATQAGQILGRALENYNGTGTGSVVAFVETGYHDPNLTINEIGNLDSRIDTLETSVASLNNEVTQLTSQLNSTQTSLSNLETAVLNMSESFSTNRFGVGVAAPATDSGKLIDTISGAYLSDGGVWTNVSDINKKENFQAIDADVILSGIANLDITSWNYITEADSIRHIGPTAQDFYSVFGFGANNTSISTIDPAGIALAGIKGLNTKVENIHAQIEAENEASNVERLSMVEQIKNLFSTVSSLQNQVKELAQNQTPNYNSPLISSQSIKTNTIAPQTGSEVKVESDLKVDGSVESYDIAATNATFGDLIADTIKVSTISAETIEGLDQQIDSRVNGRLAILEEKLAEFEASQPQAVATAPTPTPTPAPVVDEELEEVLDNIDGLLTSEVEVDMESEVDLSTDGDLASSAFEDVDGLFVNEFLAVNGTASIVKAEITNFALIANNMLIDGNSINSLDQETLFIQPQGGTLNLLAGLMTLDSNGSVVINGDLEVTGTLAANTLKSTKLQFGAILGEATASANTAELNDSEASQSASKAALALNDTDQLELSLATNSALVIKPQTSTDSAAQISASGEAEFATLKLNQSSGEVQVAAGSQGVIVQTDKLSANSQVIVTFQGDYSPATRYWVVKDAQAGTFTINLDKPVGKGVSAYWLIIN